MMAVPEDHLRCVAFLTLDEADDNGGIRRVPRATAFFVGIHVEGTPYRVDYIVTARHCIEEARRAIEEGASNAPLFFRFNTVAGGFVEVPTMIDDWFSSDSDDVAVVLAKPGAMPGGLTSRDVDGASLSLDAFVGEDYYWRGDAGDLGFVEVQPNVGHEVYFTGLFTEHFGVRRNLPVARFGRISRMPSELQVESGSIWFRAVAYLMEFHSWGGNSGSPVFFMYPITIQGQGSFDTGYISGLMGLVSAHYDIELKTEKTGDILGDVQVRHNSGIAVVTPAAAIRGLLMREEVVNHRREVIAAAASRQAPAPEGGMGSDVP